MSILQTADCFSEKVGLALCSNRVRSCAFCFDTCIKRNTTTASWT